MAKNVASFLVLAVLLFVPVQALAQSVLPSLKGRIVDTANLLPPNREAALSAKLQAHETKSGQQVVIATIQSLNGDDIDGYANKLFRHWGVGDKKRNDGVLFLVSKNDRKLRIEVGYGLESTLTDALSAYIIRTAIVPAFRKRDFATGIENGANQILSVLSSDEAALEDWQSRAKPRKRSSGEQPPWAFIIISVFWAAFLFGMPLLVFLAKKFGKKLGPNRYSWLGMEFDTSRKKRSRNSNGTWTGGSGGGSWGGGGGWSSGGGGGGFGGGGGSSGGGGASGGW